MLKWSSFQLRFHGYILSIFTLIYFLNHENLNAGPNLDSVFKDYKEASVKNVLEPIELNILLLKKRLEIWDALEEKIRYLINELKKIYNPITTPFYMKKADTNSIHFNTKSVSKSFLEGEKKIRILNIAKNDRIQSQSFSKNDRLPAAQFQLKTADKEFKFNFPGGSIYDLYQLLQKQQDQRYYYVYLITIDYLNNKDILLLEGAKTGLENQLIFSGDLDFLSKIGIIKSQDKQAYQKKEADNKVSKDEKLQSGKSKEEKKELEWISIDFKSHQNRKKNLSEKETQIEDSKALKTESIKSIQTQKINKISYIEFFARYQIGKESKIEKIEKKDPLKEKLAKKEKEKELLDLDIGKIDVFRVEDFDFKTKALSKYLNKEKEWEKNKLEEENITKPEIQKNLKDQQEDKDNKKKRLFLKIDFIDKRGKSNLKQNLEWKIELLSEQANQKKTEEKNWKKFRYEIPEKFKLEPKKIDHIRFLGKYAIKNDDQQKWFLKDLKIGILKKPQSPIKKEKNKGDLETMKIAQKRKRGYNFIQQAENAKIILDGIQFERSNNLINDILPGIHLELKSKNQHAESLFIEKDYQLINDFIKNWVVVYNSFFIFISNIIDTLKDQEEIQKYIDAKNSLKKWKELEDEFNEKSLEEKKYEIHIGKAYRGYMNYEYMLKNLKDRILKMIFSTPYAKEVNKKIFFLTQIGIKPYLMADNENSLYDKFNLRKGLLKIDENEFVKQLKVFFYEIEYFFGYKTNGSILKNKGLAIELVKFLNHYVKRTKKDKRFHESLIDIKKRKLKQTIRLKEKLYEKQRERVISKVGRFERDIKKAKQYEEYYKSKKDYFRSMYESMNIKPK